MARVEVGDGIADGQHGANGPLRVVPVGGRRAEDGHHRVADELLDHASERLQLGANGLVVRIEDRANVLGIEPLGARREPDDVDEDDADDAALLARLARGALERGRAGEAEPGDFRIFLTAGGAGDHPPSLRPRSGHAAER